jgi:hypothetical protein
VCLLVTVLAVALGTGLLLAEVGPMREFWPDVAGGGVAALTLALPLLVPGSSTAFALATFAVGATIVGAVLFSRRIHLVAHVLGTGLAAESAALVAHDNTALAIALAGVTALAVTSAVRNASRAANIVLAVMAASGALAAGWVAAGEPQVPAGLATLAVPLAVAAALVSMRHTARVGSTLAVEAAEAAAVAVGATAVAVVAALDGAGWFAWALALAGVAVLAQSVRPDRRQAWYGGLALLTVSSWTHLAVADVHLVEAYSLPVSFVVLAVGGYRRSRDTTVSSVQAFGSGLAGALLPSLFAGFADAALTRSVIVLVCAAAVAAIGAGLRLQAPLVVGSLVALADALWLAAPHVAALPRWVSLGAVGAALIFLGATYERRRFQAGQLAEHVRTFA